MPVLVERLSLMVRRAQLPDSMFRAWVALMAQSGASSALSDGELACASFSDERALSGALRTLVGLGLPFWKGTEPGDIAVVSQTQGPAYWWPWLELGHVSSPDGHRVLAARVAGSSRCDVTSPPSWTYAGSATQRLGIVDLPLADRPLRHVRREATADVYRDLFAGGEVCLPRKAVPARLVLRTSTGEHAVEAELALTRDEIEVGLMFRPELAPDTGMLFVFHTVGTRCFWMKNTLVALDMLFLGTDGRVIGVVDNAHPLTLAPRRIDAVSKDVLELPAGWAAAHRVVAGDRVLPAAHA